MKVQLDSQLGTSPMSSMSIVLNLIVSLHSEPRWDWSKYERDIRPAIQSPLHSLPIRQ